MAIRSELPERLRPYQDDDERQGSAWVAPVGFIAAAVIGSLIGLAVVEALFPRQTPEVQALCNDSTARLLHAETLVEIGREKVLLTTMRCNVGWSVRELRPVARPAKADSAPGAT
jgi:hypothetical protein